VPEPAVFEKAAVAEPEKSVPTHLPEPVEKTFVEETHAPSFSMGAPAIDEEEPANSKKAIIILAVVVILASLAGYLGWKNMSGKSPATPAPQVQPPPTAPAPSPSSSLPASGDSNPVTAAEPTTVATSPEPVTAQPAKPSAKMIAKDSTRPVAPSAASPEEKQPSVSAPALIVHNETSKASPKAAAPDTDSASAPAPSALGLTSNPDPNALSAISNAPVAVPKASAQVVKLSQGVSEGLILKKVSPHYPAQALQMHVEGSVQLQATISKDGSISNLKILSGDPLLSRAAQDAVKQWKYKPYYLDGEPVDIQTQITINFKLPR
jgi:protein TonB